MHESTVHVASMGRFTVFNLLIVCVYGFECEVG
jgi:hypothetical protein